LEDEIQGAAQWGLSVLVADDNEVNLEVALGLFSAEGARVALAENGQQALQWLRQHPSQADIVLMDVNMPVMNGFEATRHIRADAALASLPVVAVSAGVVPPEQAAALAAGMNDFLGKPFEADAAVEVILKLAGSGRAKAAPGIDQQSPPEPVHIPDGLSRSCGSH
jgi:CheY-like chemotaxis protein